MDEEKRKAFHEKLTVAAAIGLEGARELGKRMVVSSTDPLFSTMATLARLKSIEQTMLLAARDMLGISLEDAQKLLDGAEHTILLWRVLEGTLTRKDAESLLRDKAAGARQSLMKAEARASGKISPEDIKQALVDLEQGFQVCNRLRSL